MATLQRGLFDAPEEPDIPLNSTVHPSAAPRLSRQSRQILARLRQGRATNGELAGIGIRYSARICEMRKVGFRIEIVERDEETGLNTYELVEEAEVATHA